MKKGLPREVSQSRISVGRGNVASSRVWSSSWVAPRLRPATVDRLEPVLGQGAAKPLRHVAADRQQGDDRLTIQAGERVAERRTRCRIQPLDVVDREAEGTVTGEPSQGFEEGGGHGTVVGVDLGLTEQQRGFESPPLDRRQLGDDIGGDIAE